FDTKQLKYLYCAPHSFILGSDIGEMIEECKDVLGYIHIADSLRPERTFFSGRYHPKVLPHQHLLAGKGDVDFPKLFGALRRMNYTGFLSINPFSCFDKPLETLRDSKPKIDALL
ncbi:MAG: sugar phosphate isomerase/epimerase family protein, partial [Nitrososphaerales archaeon]